MDASGSAGPPDTSRKRSRQLHEDTVPNRKVQKIDLIEKEKIKRLAEEESKRTFYLQPHQPQQWTTPPLLTYMRPPQTPSFPLFPATLDRRLSNPFIQPYPPQTSPFTTDHKTPSSPKAKNDEIRPSPLSQYPILCSPHSIQSPFLYMYNRSPVSPMLLMGGSPCPPSVASCPSVGSTSSGCSSMSETSASSPKKKTDRPRIAPSEYHVGITLPPPPTASQQQEEEEDSTPSPPEMNSSISHGSAQPPIMSTYNPVSTDKLSITTNQPETSKMMFDEVQQHHHYQYYNGNNSCLSSPASSRGSSPEPDVDCCVKPNVTNNNEVFCLVPGRLSLLSSTQKYKVTLDEVRRRLSSPECLNASVLGGILRRAKSKNGGNHLRQKLESEGLSLPAGRRKQTELFLLTSLVEGEAVHLADDFKRLCDGFFPHSELAHIIGAQHTTLPHVERRISMVQAAQVLIQELQAMINTVGGPSNLSPSDPSNPYKGLTNFSLISHGFGNPNISTVLSVVQTYFNELLKVYEGHRTMASNVPTNGHPSSSSGGLSKEDHGRYSSKGMKRERKDKMASQ